MKLAFLLVLVTLTCPLAFAKGGSGGSHSVKGHVTKSGAYVPPHRATNPDSTKTNNWSQKGNTNPYTGKEGTKK
jgi:hypothetical protein